MRVFFLADDLSGALDAAAAFHHAGRRVTIALSPEDWPEDEATVLGLTTETRNLPPAAAAARVTATLARSSAHGARLVYKKIDSTLRGPVAAELMALCAALPAVRVLFCSANPAAGRTVRDGILRVRGVPVAETEFGRDPAWPVRESAVRSVLGAAATSQVWIADAESDDDLARAVGRMEAEGGPWVGVGSGALAKAIASRTPRTVATAPPAEWPGRGPALFVCGSAHPLNRGQAAALVAETGWTCHDVDVSDPMPAAEAALAGVRTRGGAVLRLATPRTESDIALRAIARAASVVLQRGEISRVFVTGGETAFALGAALGVRRLEFAAEIEPGLSLSKGEALGRPMSWAVKPGGFGDTATWQRAWRAWQSGAANSSMSARPSRRLPEP